MIAYSHCIAHGYDLCHGLEHQKLAAESGYWPLYRYDPRRAARGEHPFMLDSAHPKADVSRLLSEESRFQITAQHDPGALSRAQRRGAAANCAAHRALRGDGKTLMKLTTRYLGLELAHPFMPGASPLADTLDSVRQLEDAGASAIVMRSLFEEQILRERFGPSGFAMGPDAYLEQLRRIKARVSIPVIASINGTTTEGWLKYARLLQKAEADAVELNFYHLPTDPGESAASVEARLLDIVAVLKESITIPLAVKLSAVLFVAAESRGAARRHRRAGNRSLQSLLSGGHRSGRARHNTAPASVHLRRAVAPTALACDRVGVVSRVAGDYGRRPSRRSMPSRR